MNITIIGASAGVGLEAVKRALERGHHVTTLARSEIALPASEQLIKLKGSATDPVALKQSIEDAQAIIVALGTGKSMKATTLYSDFARVLLELHAHTNVQIPVIVLTGFGAGASGQYHSNFIMKLLFKFLLKDVYADKTQMEQMLAASNLNWVIVRPGLLKDEPLSEEYRVENHLFSGMKIGPIGRADVADFLVKQAEKPNALKQYTALSKR